MSDLTCDEVRDAAAGYALDIIEAAPRAAVAAHLSGCPRCRDEMGRVQASADELLDLGSVELGSGRPISYPAASLPVGNGDLESRRFEPPPGGPGTQVGMGRRRFRVVATLAAVALLMVGSTFGTELERGGGEQTRPAATGTFLQDSRSVGQVNVYSGKMQVIEVSLRHLSSTSDVIAEAVTANGVIGLGTIRLYKGFAYWATQRSSGLVGATQVLLVDKSGDLVATADLSQTELN